MDTIAEFIRSRAGDQEASLFFEDQQWSYDEFFGLCCQRAAYLLAHRKPGPFHVGVLLDNVPEFPFWLGACAIAGATLVGLNPTRRGGDMARDIVHTDCQFLVINNNFQAAVASLEIDMATEQVLNIDTDSYQQQLDPFIGSSLPAVTVKPEDTYLLILTSGTTGAPKACICSHGRFAGISSLIADAMEIGSSSVSYVVMPWFHANAIYMGWLPALSKGAGVVMGTFSVSNFLPDVRRFGVTHFNYVGKPLAYLLGSSGISVGRKLKF